MRDLAAPLVILSALPGTVSAQTDVEELGRRFGANPPPQYYQYLQENPGAFEFSPDNGWIRRARSVAAQRNRMRASRSEGFFMLQRASSVGGVMTGDVYMPVFLIMFSNTDSAQIASTVPRSSLETRLYSTDPAPPYSIHNFFREVSNDLVNVYGTVYDWVRVSGSDATYEGTDNGLNCARMGGLMRDAATVLDDTVDFSQFDNDGPDGIPNSLDDDGYVDAVVMIHPKVDGSCKFVNPAAETSIWAHRCSSVSYTTNDASNATGGNVKFRDYIIQGGQGGDGGCTSNEPQAMGVVAHETGHLFGLPDLYEIGGNGAGIGRWGLMGSGGQLTAYRPTHLNAWSKAQLGWVTEVLIDSDTTLEISPIVTSDTAYVLPISGTNEFFMLENRQRIGSDSMIYREGLLVWHVDSVLARTRGNNVNTPIYPYGVALEQADGRDDLRNGGNRGDQGDPFPGISNNRRFGRNTTPSSNSNDGTVSYVLLDSITQVSDFGPISLKIGFEAPALIAATDTNAVFRLNGVQYRRFEDFLNAGATYSLEIDSLQTVDSGRRRFEWKSWSNGQARSHTFTAAPSGDTIIANVEAEYLLTLAELGTGSGTVSSDVPLDLANGEFLSVDSVVTLVAEVDSAGHIFEGWFGSDTTASSGTLELRMSRPFAVEAVFAAPLVVADETLPTATMGTDFNHRIAVDGGTGTESWELVSGALPFGLTLSEGGVVSGLPEETGSFPLGLVVTSGSQTVSETLNFSVAAPALTVADVLQHLVGEGTTLSDEDILYLDLVGNYNSVFDLGDFLGWVEATGGTVSAQELRAVLDSARLEDGVSTAPPGVSGERRRP